MKKKKKILLTISIVIILAILGVTAFILIKDINKIEVELISNLSIEINEKATNVSFIKNVNNAKIITKEETIDTSKLGDKDIKIILKNNLKQKKEYKYTVKVIDTIKPVITFNNLIEVTEGDNKNLLEGVSVIDNSKEDIDITIEGEYDLNKVGEYTIYFVAKDASNNITKEEVTLKVKEKVKLNSNNETITAVDKTFTTSKGFKGEVKNGVTYIEGILIANKTYSLPSTYGTSLTNETMQAFNEMKNAASREGLNIYIVSGFRSYNHQYSLYNNYVALDGKEAADTYSARPGHSEHQTGLSFDLNDVNEPFAYTNEGIWLSANAYKYGFILRYPKDKTHETGYIYEPWHFRYVGQDLASKLYNNGEWTTLESYFGITSTYN